MLKKILLGLAVLVVGILAAALLKSPDFRVERSLVIAAPAEKLFPYFDNHKKFTEWNPWAKMDPEAEDNYTGPEGRCLEPVAGSGRQDHRQRLPATVAGEQGERAHRRAHGLAGA